MAERWGVTERCGVTARGMGRRRRGLLSSASSRALVSCAFRTAEAFGRDAAFSSSEEFSPRCGRLRFGAGAGSDVRFAFGAGFAFGTDTGVGAAGAGEAGEEALGCEGLEEDFSRFVEPDKIDRRKFFTTTLRSWGSEG